MLTEMKLAPSNASIGNDTDALHDIHSKNKNIAIYQRNIDAWKAELEQLVTQKIDCRISGSVYEITSFLEIYFKDNLPDCGFLLEDVNTLLRLFQKVTQAASFRVLLATVSTNMCRKFHTDFNSLRMLCTYVGPGTLWVPDEIVNHKASQINGQDLILDESLIQQGDAGDVIILKGALYPESNAILHRSPTIEETGKKRLLLRIDTNESIKNWI